ncbi:MAG: HNH endonuclease [Saprospiraceae bacterium]|nr:HNH endonuclease [Saprospiraceae bacterium]
MSQRVPNSVKLLVGTRALFRCEYCQMLESDSFLPFEIDHIVSQKHGGGNELENLAYACPHCNQYKGTDLTTFLSSYKDIVAIFNPREQAWADHFYMENGEIIAKSRVAEATIKLLRLNEPERLIIRRILSENRG